MSALSLPNVQDSRILSITNVFIAVVLVAIIVGLWRYQYWAWFATMVVTGFALICGIWHYFNGSTPYVNLLLNSLVALYLNQHDFRRVVENQHFREATTRAISNYHADVNQSVAALPVRRSSRAASMGLSQEVAYTRLTRIVMSPDLSNPATMILRN